VLLHLFALKANKIEVKSNIIQTSVVSASSMICIVDERHAGMSAMYPLRENQRELPDRSLIILLMISQE
jgi:hypothetical protein